MPTVTYISSNQWIQGLAVILITFLIASGITWIFFKIADYLTDKTKLTLDNQIASLLRPPVYYTLVMIGIISGLDLMPLSHELYLKLTRILQSLNVLIWMIFTARLSTLLLNRRSELHNKFSFIQSRTVTLFDNLAKLTIMGAGTYAIFVIWSINMTAWLASAGIAGIALGFAAKDTLSNLFSGVFILADAPYKVGDYVVLDKVGRGMVTQIGLRSTRILTRDDIEVTVPNSIIGNTTLINQSGGPHEKLRIRLKIGVAYGSDIDKVKAILEEAARQEPLVCTYPEPRVRFRLFGASSLDFELLFWVDKPENRGRVLDIMNSTVYKQFTRENIEIPYSKQDVYIKGLPGSLAPGQPTDTTDTVTG
ncbi:MAG: mechanosensitive ion channel protein [Proteobacteria bacterium]|nr:MAG: mechanosensitive ion channel protein [Pseudomonadota bacterium]PIE65012.1 MAG: mechanosensitive ion channel protein [Desulfobacterales bacterium]